MQKFTVLNSTICSLDIANIDTDQIIPKQFLKRIERTGFGKFLFYDWRHTSEGKLISDFSLNRPEYKKAKILLTRDNFGCGSSREHAPWALFDYGFRSILATSFADIFYNNCFQNGILPIVLKPAEIDSLFTLVTQKPYSKFKIDLPNQKITSIHTTQDQMNLFFEIDKSKKDKFLHGLDDIGVTLQFEKVISDYEKQRYPSGLSS